MIDLHTHYFFSDGELVPAELIRRAEEKGYRYLAITDHVDYSNYKFIIDNVGEAVEKMQSGFKVKVFVGVEITHVPPNLIGKAVELAWKEGAEIVIVHGETIAEPVKEGTNYMAVQEEIDILAHPGLIDIKTAELASENGVYLEISARRGHCLTNGHVAKVAMEVGCELVINTDAHAPSDFIDTDTAIKILKGAGVENVEDVLNNARKIMKKRLK